MRKIKALIFDFGDVFINLDKQGAMDNALQLFNIKKFEADTINIKLQYEVGKISTPEFIAYYRQKFPIISEERMIEAWNFILKDFPKHRFKWIQQLANEKQFKLILLSNTNEMHIDFIKNNVSFYNQFKTCFDKFYLSHEIHLRKPDRDIFDFVLNENNLNAEDCLFIDDTKENTDMAKQLGIHIWNIDETREDVVNLFEIKSHLF